MAMIDILRQPYFPRNEIIGRDRKISGCYTKGYSCLMGEKTVYKLLLVSRQINHGMIFCGKILWASSNIYIFLCRIDHTGIVDIESSLPGFLQGQQSGRGRDS